MKAVSTLQNGQYLSTAYDFYASGQFTNPEPNMVGTSMCSDNNLYWGHLSIDGSFNLYLGRLPDHLWGTIWRTPSSDLGLSVTRTGVMPDTIYTLLLDNNGVLNVQASGTTIWKSTGPTDTSAGAYFAKIGDDGALTLSTGTPSSPGAVYFSSASNQGTVFVQRDDDAGNVGCLVQVRYLDARSSEPGSLVTTTLGLSNQSAIYNWPATLPNPDPDDILGSLPVATTLLVTVGADRPVSVPMGLYRRVTLQIGANSVSLPIGIGTQLTA